jgi:putative phosphoribosyl transferase
MSPEIVMLQDRLQAAHLLAEKFLAYRNSDAVVVAVPRGGVPIGFALSTLLNISFEIMPCKKIKHPAYANKSIGSVSVDDFIVSEGSRNIPQDYIYHQTILLQQTLKNQSAYFRGDKKIIALGGRTVILVDDVIQSGDTIMACLRSLKRQKADRIILATAIATPEIAELFSNEVDEFVALQTEKKNLHNIFPPVTDQEVRNILAAN